MEHNYPALARWMHRIESLPGYERNLSAALGFLGAGCFLGASRQFLGATRQFPALRATPTGRSVPVRWARAARVLRQIQSSAYELRASPPKLEPFRAQPGRLAPAIRGLFFNLKTGKSNWEKNHDRHEVHVNFGGRIRICGFRQHRQGILPLILRHIGTSAVASPS